MIELPVTSTPQAIVLVAKLGDENWGKVKSVKSS